MVLEHKFEWPKDLLYSMLTYWDAFFWYKQQNTKGLHFTCCIFPKLHVIRAYEHVWLALIIEGSKGPCREDDEPAKTNTIFSYHGTSCSWFHILLRYAVNSYTSATINSHHYWLVQEVSRGEMTVLSENEADTLISSTPFQALNVLNPCKNKTWDKSTVCTST